MDTCFDYSKCEKGFKVYVYPPDPFGGQSKPSDSYEKVTKLYCIIGRRSLTNIVFNFLSPSITN